MKHSKMQISSHPLHAGPLIHSNILSLLSMYLFGVEPYFNVPVKNNSKGR